MVNETHNSLGEILTAQRAAFLRDGSPSYQQRIDDLKKLRSAIVARRNDIAEAVMSDFGHRAPFETAIMETMSLLLDIDYLVSNLRRFMRPTKRRVAITMQLGFARIEYQPLGVIGIVVPWNFPFALAVSPLATAIAAGNRVMLKPSEVTPATANVLAALVSDIFHPEEVAVVTGDARVGAAFTSLPFDHLLYTGSTNIGRAVMKAASDNLTPVTLELGGKSPVIVEKGSPLPRAAEGIAYGKLTNAGQICIAPDYALVHVNEIDSFVAAYQQAVTKFYPDGPVSDDYTSIVNERHFDRLNGLLDDARLKGADVFGVGAKTEMASSRPHNLAPTVVLNGTDDMRIMKEEIFGPILPIVTYRRLDEAIAYVNARPRPLALYYFGDNPDDRRKVLDNTTSGGVTINNTLLHFVQEDLPFGGVGPSGMGSYHGVEGFRTFSHAKAVFEQTKWSSANMLRPPFRGIARNIVRLILR